MSNSSHYTATHRLSRGGKGANPIAIKGSRSRTWYRVLEGLSEDLEKIMIGQDEEKFFQVGSQLPSLERVALVKFLEDNMDVFAWSTYDVPGIDLEFICHQLNVNPEATL